MAQVGGSAAIAPHAPTAAVQGRSPLFNWANGLWDHGEGFPAPDNGGVISPSNPALLQRSDIRPLSPAIDPPTNWPVKQNDSNNVRHVIAEIRPASPVQSPEAFGASFEIAIPAEGFPDATKKQHIVLLLSTEQTSFAARPEDNVYAPHAYPGDPGNFGIRNWPWPYGPALVREFANMPAAQAPFYVAAGHIVPRTSFQPLVSSVQRLRELWRAMILLINEHSFPPPSTPPAYTVAVAGGSFGGLTTQAALLLWPDEFHSGTSVAFEGNLRGTPNAQNMLDFLMAGLGLGAPGSGYSMRSALDWTIFTRLEQVDFVNLTTVSRALAQGPPPGVQRPLTLFVGDEDPVANGLDWLHPLGSTSGHAEPYSQRRTLAQGTSSWNVDAIKVGKTCHGGDATGLAEPFLFPNDPIGTMHFDVTDGVRNMIHAAYAERGHVVAPLTLQQRRVPQSPSLLTLDGHDKVFRRKAARGVPQPPAPFLVEATTQQGWNRYGRGTWLGTAESLKVRKLPGDMRASIFFGSADGLVTRVQMDPAAVPPDQPLVQMAVTGSLGYAVYALDVGSLDASGQKVVAATYDRVYVLDAINLAVERTLTLTEWEQTEPRRLQIAEIYGGNSGAEIVFRSLHGRIVILGLGAGGQLTILGQHEENGVVDLAIGPQVGPRITGTQFSNGIWLLSARGHVAGLELNSVAPDSRNMGILSVASALQYGGPWDLDVKGNELAALYWSEQGSIRIFERNNLNVIAQFGRLDHPSVLLDTGDIVELTMPGPTQGSEPSLAITAQGQYVTLFADHLAVWNHGSDVAAGVKDLRTFPLAQGATTVQVGDVDSDNVDDVVLPTQSGHVVWLKISELTTFGQSLALTRSVRVVGNQLYDHRANAAISATWGFAGISGTPPRLHAIDVTGGWWVVDPLSGVPVIFGGRPSFVLETGIPGLRGLAYGGAGASSFSTGTTGGSNDTFWVVDPGLATTSKAIRTSPYMPTTVGSFANWGHVSTPLSVVSWDDFWLLRQGGAAIFDATTNQWRVAWWGVTFFPNLVQQLTYSLQPPIPTSLWSSTKTGTGGPPPSPQVIGGSGSQAGVSLRSSVRFVESMDLQSLRLGRVISGSQTLHPVVIGTGGRVIVLDGNNGQILVQSEDLGFGGMALAVADLNSPPDGQDEIIVAPAVSPADAVPPPMPYTNGGHMRSFVHVLRHNGTALVRVSTQPIGDPYATHDLHGYGACGIAVADLDFPTDGVPEVIVTTLNGELVVLGQVNGVLGAPRFQTIVEGQLGAFNSIVVGDFDQVWYGNKPEIYIASTTGVRKFYVQ